MASGTNISVDTEKMSVRYMWTIIAFGAAAVLAAQPAVETIPASRPALQAVPAAPAPQPRAAEALQAAYSAPIVAPAAEPQPVVSEPIMAQVADKVLLGMLDSRVWAERFNVFGFGGVLGTIASHCELRQRDGARLTFVLDSRHAAFFDNSHVQRIQEQLCGYFEQPLTASIDVGQPQAETPYARRERLRAEQLAAARSAILADPNIRLLQESFGAQLDETSIEPINDQAKQ